VVPVGRNDIDRIHTVRLRGLSLVISDRR
jgi:hypothetical protein